MAAVPNIAANIVIAQFTYVPYSALQYAATFSRGASRTSVQIAPNATRKVPFNTPSRCAARPMRALLNFCSARPVRRPSRNKNIPCQSNRRLLASMLLRSLFHLETGFGHGLDLRIEIAGDNGDSICSRWIFGLDLKAHVASAQLAIAAARRRLALPKFNTGQLTVNLSLWIVGDDSHYSVAVSDRIGLAPLEEYDCGKKFAAWSDLHRFNNKLLPGRTIPGIEELASPLGDRQVHLEWLRC